MSQATAQLRLEVEAPTDPVLVGEPCPVRVTLVNAGTHRLLVNGRLEVGYRDHVAREIFADLTDLAGDQPARICEVDYDRAFSPASAYVWLEPGRAVSRTFDLFEWYCPEAPGDYRLVMHYQADEPLAAPAPDLVRGVFSSEPVSVRVVASA